MERLIAIGEVLAPHGVRGELKVRPLTDFPQRFRRLKRAFLGAGDGPSTEVLVERATVEVKRLVDTWGEPKGGLEVMKGFKAQYDPQGILSSGRFVGGI